MGRQCLRIISLFSTVEYVNPFRERQGTAQQVRCPTQQCENLCKSIGHSSVCLWLVGQIQTDTWSLATLVMPLTPGSVGDQVSKGKMESHGGRHLM